jgi:hypothetical protein
MNAIYKFSLVLLIVFFACIHSVYAYGRCDHKESGITSKRNSLNDSCILIDPGGNIPAGAIRVCETDIKLSFFYPVLHSPSAFRKLLQIQALKLGGNVIQFGQYVPIGKGRVHIKGTIYSLNQEAFDRYKQQERDRAKENEKYCVVHIKNLIAYNTGSISLLVDDSLFTMLPVNPLSENERKENVYNILPSEAQTYTFKTVKNVKLFASAVPKKGYRVSATIELEKGKEYYLYLTYQWETYHGDSGPDLQFLKYHKGTDLSPF